MPPSTNKTCPPKTCFPRSFSRGAAEVLCLEACGSSSQEVFSDTVREEFYTNSSSAIASTTYDTFEQGSHGFREREELRQ